MIALIGLGLLIIGIAALWSIKSAKPKSGPFTRKYGL